MENLVESANALADNIVSGSKHKDEGPRIRDGESRIINAFPYFLIITVVVFVSSLLFREEITMSVVLGHLCASFIICFTGLGVPCALMMPSGKFHFAWVLLGSFIITMVIWIGGYLTDTSFYPDAILNMLKIMGVELEGASSMIVGLAGTYMVILFAPIAVLFVISAYIRRYIPRVFRSIDVNARTGKRGLAEKFFMIPDMVDVDHIELDARRYDHLYDLKAAIFTSSYLFLFGLLISSYLFINPLFLESMDWKAMLGIMIMLSMFTPALVMPWQIVRIVGAKAECGTPRRYDLWIGAKRRLFGTFIALSAFMMMFVLSMYLGYDILDLVKNYLMFLLPLLMTSIVYGMLYANNFLDTDRDTICERFQAYESTDIVETDE